MTDKEINALIRLLDDPDEDVYKAVKKKIMDNGDDILPALTHAWQQAMDRECNNRLLMKRFERLVPALQDNMLLGLIKQWSSESGSLREISWLISRFEFFALDRERFDEELDKFRDMMPTYTLDNFTPLEQVRIFNNTFYKRMGFHPVDTHDYYNPLNCIPFDILTSRAGNPTSLSLIYMMLANEAGLPIKGVNLPKNFILAYSSSQQTADFYINPMSKGIVFERHEIDRFLQDMHLKPQQQFYAPCDDRTIIKRLLCRLEFSYRTKKDTTNSDIALQALKSLGDPLDNMIDWE